MFGYIMICFQPSCWGLLQLNLSARMLSSQKLFPMTRKTNSKHLLPWQGISILPCVATYIHYALDPWGAHTMHVTSCPQSTHLFTRLEVFPAPGMTQGHFTSFQTDSKDTVCVSLLQL